MKLLPDVPFIYQYEISYRLGSFSTVDAPLVELLSPLTRTKNGLVRGPVFTALERLAIGHPDHADRIAKILEVALDSSDRQTRMDAAFSLGRLKAKSSLPLLKKLRDENIEAAFLAWQLDGSAEAFFEIANRFLERKGLLWQNRACIYVANVAEQESIPTRTRQLLQELADQPIDIHPSRSYNLKLKGITRQARKILASSNPSDP